MESIFKSIDIEKHIGEVVLSNGSKLPLPKIGMKKVISIVKFIGVDGFKLWDKASKIMRQTDMDTFSKFALVIDSLEDTQLVKIQSILLDISEQDALALDLNETLDVFIQYAEKNKFGKDLFSNPTSNKSHVQERVTELRGTAGQMVPENRGQVRGSKSINQGSANESNSRTDWTDFCEQLVKEIGFVSSYYGYTEEYVLDHTPAWIKRKYKQAITEKYERHVESVYGQFKSYLLLMDSMMNEGKDFTNILPPTLDAAIEQQKNQAESTDAQNNQEEYVKTPWWLGQEAEEA
ncbi:hypothetical protein ACT7DN_30305 [Bacillus paranthracis]